jgi:hypothetical protein
MPPGTLRATVGDPRDGDRCRGWSRGGRGVLPVLRRAASLAPSLRRGLGVTLALALLGTAGQVVVPIAVQQVIDREVLGADDRPDRGDRGGACSPSLR